MSWSRLLIFAVVAPLADAAAQATGAVNLRPTTVTLIVTNDTHYDGTYVASGISRVCGKLDLMMPHRVNSFVVEFPDDEPNLAVRSVTFDADTLPAGSTTNSFYLSVGIHTPQGGTPPAFVVRAKEPIHGEPGAATRISAGGTDTLKIKGTATKGTKVDVALTIVCQRAK